MAEAGTIRAADGSAGNAGPVLLDATATAVELPSMSGYMETLYARHRAGGTGAGEVRLHGGSAGEQTSSWLGFAECCRSGDHSGGDCVASR